MRDNQSWSLGVGRWGHVSLRIHMFLILAVGFMFGAEWNPGALNSNFFTGTAMVTVSAFLVAVVLHQAAHAFAIRSLGGEIEEIVFMPWGGTCTSSLPNSRPSSLLAHTAGIFLNGILFLIGMALLYRSGDGSIWSTVNPFQPHHFDATNSHVSFLQIFTWINFQLMVVNLIPCFPFDGAHIVRTILESMELDTPKYRIETAIMLIGHAVAFALIGTAAIWVFKHFEPGIGVLRPGWLYLLVAGTVMFFAAKHSMIVETAESNGDWEKFQDYDFGSMYDTTMFHDFSEVSDIENVAYSQWLSEKQDERRQQELESEVEEDSLADTILEKLHLSGGDVSCLSDSERSVLHRFSERVRRRRSETVSRQS